MRKINRLGWAEGFAFKSYGVKIGVRATESGFLHSLMDLIPTGSQPHDDAIVDRLYSFVVGGADPRRNVRRMHLVYSDALRLARDRTIEPVLHAFDADLRLFIGYAARRRVFIHAGVVGVNGRAIVIPGRTFTGKSTLVAEFVRSGATYYSDEYAVLDQRGRVHPYAKPLSIRDGDSIATRRGVEEFGGVAGSSPIPLGLILDTHYRAGARWRPIRQSAGAGAMALLANTVSARARPARNLPVIRRAVAGAIVMRGVRGEAAELVREFLDSSIRGGNLEFASIR